MTQVGHIYAIKNKLNGMYYVGQTRREKVEVRWAEHRTSSKFFSEHLHAVGEGNFEFILLETVPLKYLNAHERGWIDLLNAVHPHGYNKIVGGHGHAITCQATRDKMSKSRKGKPHSAEHTAAIAAALKGRSYVMSEAQHEAKKALDDQRRGRPLSPSHYAALKAAGERKKGVRLSEETCRRISAVNTGRKASDETKAKMSAAHRNRRQTNTAQSYAKGWARRRQRHDQGVFA